MVSSYQSLCRVLESALVANTGRCLLVIRGSDAGAWYESQLSQGGRLVDSISSIESPAGEASHQSFLRPTTSDARMNGSEPQAPATLAKGIRCPPHHWMVGPPRYTQIATDEETHWVCAKCGRTKTHKFGIPYAERSLACQEETFGQR